VLPAGITPLSDTEQQRLRAALRSLRALYGLIGAPCAADRCPRLAALIAFLNAKLAAGIDVTLVSWNGRGFDLPVIVARCLRHGLAFPWYYAGEARRR
jgi:hypothetical protein